MRPRFFEIGEDRLGGAVAERHDTLLGPLADRAQEPGVEHQVLYLDPDQFGDAKTGRVEQLEHSGIAQATGSAAIGSTEKSVDLRRLQRIWQRAPELGRLQVLRRVALQMTLGDEEAEETANARQPPSHRTRRDACRAQRLEVTGQVRALHALQIQSLLLQPITEPAEIVPIRSERVLGQPLFHGDVIEIHRQVCDEEGRVAVRGWGGVGISSPLHEPPPRPCRSFAQTVRRTRRGSRAPRRCAGSHRTRWGGRTPQRRASPALAGGTGR